jgi:hypothetical protein
MFFFSWLGRVLLGLPLYVTELAWSVVGTTLTAEHRSIRGETCLSVISFTTIRTRTGRVLKPCFPRKKPMNTSLRHGTAG